VSRSSLIPHDPRESASTLATEDSQPKTLVWKRETSGKKTNRDLSSKIKQTEQRTAGQERKPGGDEKFFFFEYTRHGFRKKKHLRMNRKRNMDSLIV
jgi:hypothetical protein